MDALDRYKGQTDKDNQTDNRLFVRLFLRWSLTFWEFVVKYVKQLHKY